MLGEPKEKSLVLRTSIIGREISGFTSLLELVLQQEGKRLKVLLNIFGMGLLQNNLAKFVPKLSINEKNSLKTDYFIFFQLLCQNMKCC